MRNHFSQFIKLTLAISFDFSFVHILFHCDGENISNKIEKIYNDALFLRADTNRCTRNKKIIIIIVLC